MRACTQASWPGRETSVVPQRHAVRCDSPFWQASLDRGAPPQRRAALPRLPWAVTHKGEQKLMTPEEISAMVGAGRRCRGRPPPLQEGVPALRARHEPCAGLRALGVAAASAVCLRHPRPPSHAPAVEARRGHAGGTLHTS